MKEKRVFSCAHSCWYAGQVKAAVVLTWICEFITTPICRFMIQLISKRLKCNRNIWVLNLMGGSRWWVKVTEGHVIFSQKMSAWAQMRIQQEKVWQRECDSKLEKRGDRHVVKMSTKDEIRGFNRIYTSSPNSCSTHAPPLIWRFCGCEHVWREQSPAALFICGQPPASETAETLLMVISSPYGMATPHTEHKTSQSIKFLLRPDELSGQPPVKQHFHQA